MKKLSIISLIFILFITAVQTASAGQRVIYARLKEAADGSVNAFCVIKFLDADLNQTYEARLTLKENGSLLGTGIITLLPGDRKQHIDYVSSKVEIFVERWDNIVAKYVFFDISAKTDDTYECTMQFLESGTQVGAGISTARFQ